MRQKLGVVAFVATILSAIYTLHLSSIYTANALVVLFLSGLTSSFFYFEFKFQSNRSTENKEVSELKELMEVEQLKANLERIKYQNAQDQARRDELSAQGKTESKYFF